ncbi:hypothetical protein [Kitasatospora cineracea]|uniref:LPXTG-motif cell wall-anchored protein n=1 Tax=Kitasatospora cineracea TaxID=88074 RepID=A0A8G1XD05_9ACTN|nr:hypothetical protein [Kitasatospora cineracea]ROR43731.1 hypothetical protein EDD39_1900 [Kitasatospora cineracea]
MRTSRSRSLGLATALAALALGGAAVPAAHAADSTLKIEAPDAVAVDPDSTAPDHGSNSTRVQLDLTLSNHPAAAMGRITIDLAPLEGIASVSTLSNSSCKTADKVLTCDALSMYGGTQELDLYLYAPAGTARPAGSSAVLHTTAVFDGVTASADTKVTLGGSNVVVNDIPATTGLKPGDVWKPLVKITNKGQLTASQLYLTFVGGTGFSLQSQFSNCKYATNDGTDVAICALPATVEAGKTVTLTPIGFTVNADAYYADEEITVATAAPDLSGWLGKFHFTPGPASAPPLVAFDAPVSSGPNGVIDFERYNSMMLQATVPNTADFVASGSWTPEAGKQQGKLTAGMVNNGPASIDWRSGSYPARVRVALPAQAKVLQKPDNCYPTSTDATVNSFDCGTTPYIRNGYRASFDFTVQADPAAKLSATVSLPSLGEDNQESGKPWDPDKANDVVTVALGGEASTGTSSPQPSRSATAEPGGSTPSAPATPAPGTASAAPSPSASGAPGTGGSTGGGSYTGGGLASTGGGQGAGTAVGLGLGAIALGGGVLVAARRRKAGARG